MDTQNLIIFNYKSLFQIIKELEENLNFKISEENDEKNLKNELNNFENYLIIAKKKLELSCNLLILSDTPIRLSKLIEKINIEFLKIQFSQKSEIKIGKYKINQNSRELIFKNIKLKLTEKETNILIYLFESKKIISVNQLQSEVWRYHSELETHTVETHIYRLRKKISETFNDNNFIISKKNGYQII